MAKKTQIDKAVEALVDRRDEIEARAAAEVAGINAAIDALHAQSRPKRVSKPRAVKPAAVVNG